MDEQTKKLKADLIAGECLQFAHASPLLHLRFMENALCRLEFTPIPKGTIWTDGQHFSYAPMHVLLRYKAERTATARDYLHCVLHCLFRHMYLHSPVEKQLWSLACDMVVEEEGCLSLSGTRKTKRWKSIKVRYQNERMEIRLKTYTGFTAQIIQHENDHCFLS